MSKIYWAVIALLLIVHLQSLLRWLPFEIPVYFTCILAVSISYYFYKKVHLMIANISIQWNGIFSFMQLLLVLIYIAVKPSWIYLVPFFMFVGIEAIRLGWANELSPLSKKLGQFEEQNKQFNETFHLVRKERHDFLKHVSAIHYLLENRKNDEAKSYLDHLVDGYEETNLSIKGERGIVAAVLHKMYRQAKDAGISIVYDFDMPLSTMPISDQNMVALIGNLLSNSIEACQEWQIKYKKQAIITLQFYKRSGLYLLICKNNSLPIPAAILDELFHTYGKTTKTGDHEGLGTKIIQDIVKDHQGFLDFIHKDEEFTVKIKIPAIMI
ncbi:sensor histidine kinase [Bacillus sp. Bva_UNVM-123]|uniref:sensor histidine kinase n=1 Tax=Bacillus sp. Bva_UNVM-123 TaxID=2829798 RepID=UPI00391FA8F1